MIGKRQFINLVIGLLAIAFILRGGLSAQAAPLELFISEYIEGSSNNKYLEIYNGTGSVVDLAAGSYDLQFFFNETPSEIFRVADRGR